MSAPTISNRKEKHIQVTALSTKALLKALDTVKPKHKNKVIKELIKRGVTPVSAAA